MLDALRSFFARLTRIPHVGWIVTTVIFTVATAVYMGPSFTNPGSVVLGNPGDHTAGIMYSNWTHPDSHKPSASPFTNYPLGEVIWQPVSVSSILTSSAHWLLSYLSNEVLAWNLLVFAGYMSCGLSMFGLVRWLTKNTLTALFVGYAVTFTPFHVFSSWGHIAGLLSGVFILAIWQLLALIEKPSRLRTLGLGVTIGLSFYMDGYFILFGGLLLGLLWIITTIHGLWLAKIQRIEKIQLFTNVGLATIVSLLFLIPLAWIQLTQSAQINAVFSNARGSIVQDAQIYSATLLMYLNPKDLLFVGYTVLLLAMIGVWQWRRAFVSKQRHQEAKSRQFIAVWSMALLAIVSIWTSLRPVSTVAGFDIYNPSKLIIALTPTWRVFGRLYMLAIVALGILAAIGLDKLLKHTGKKRYIIYGLFSVLLVAELAFFQVTAQQKTYNYRADTPHIYRWLKENNDVRAIAEYPLDELPQGSYLSDYYTYQQISHKPILNSLLPNSPQAGLRRSIAGINDPQTMPVLRALGIDLVNLRPPNRETARPDIAQAARQNQNLQFLFNHNYPKNSVSSFMVKPGTKANYALTLPQLQYFQIELLADGTARYNVDDDVRMDIIELPKAATRKFVTVSFTASSNEDRAASIVQNGRTIWQGSLTTKPQNIQFEASSKYPFVIHTERKTQPTNTTITQLRIIE